MANFRTVLVLGRVSNLPTIVTNTIAAWFLAGGRWDLTLVWLALGGCLLYVGGMTLNDAFDAKWDREHGKKRPIPEGKIGERAVWILGGVELMAGGIFLGLNGAAWVWVGILAGCVLLYNFLHKKWAGSVWIMGGCRFFLYLTVASAVTGTISYFPDELLFWAVAMLVYIAGVTYAARGEDTGGAVKGLAFCFLAFPAALALMFTGLDILLKQPWKLPVGMLALFVAWLVLSYRRLPNIGQFVASLLAGIVLVDGLAVGNTDFLAAAVCFAMLPVNLLLQRFVPAT